MLDTLNILSKWMKNKTEKLKPITFKCYRVSSHHNINFTIRIEIWKIMV